MTETKTFADFGVDPSICEALAETAITIPFPIQELALPLALAGADMIGQARTGTGKTLAFGIPLLQRLQVGEGTQALVVVPTRELCLQVATELEQASKHLGASVAAVYGGKAIDPQAEAIANGAEIVVGTPGRLLDLLRRRKLDLSTVTGLVLDEADEMLDLGFLPDVEQLIQACAADRQTLLFSATMPSAVVALARRYMHKPTFLRADVEEIHVAPKTRQFFFSCHRMDKPAVLARILQAPNRGLCLVFTRTKRMADILATELRERGLSAAAIHSDLRQDARERALARFRSGRINVLVATEVAARGLDIAEVTHVVNYDCPDDEKMYLHRIGRTGRAGADGVAVTLVVWNELARLDMIRRTLTIDEPVHEVFSTSEILAELFDLPHQERRAPIVAAATSNGSRTAVAAPPSPIEAPPSPIAAPPEQTRRTRARTRTRSQPVLADTAQPAAAPQAAAALPAKVSSPAGPRAASTPRDARPDETRPTRVRQRTSRAREDQRRDEPAARPVPAAGSRNRQRTDTRADAPPASARRNNRRADSARRPASYERNGSGHQPEPQEVDVDTARGKGRPRLRRALVITHLP
ncbi:MAG: DEAD/DEAH box helicase [Egibacteraceae bacterium]